MAATFPSLTDSRSRRSTPDILREAGWNTSDAKNFLNGSPVYDNTDPDVLKDVLTKQCPWYTPNDINTIMAGKAMCQLEKSRVGRWLQEVNPAYTDAIVSDILSGKATNQLNSSTVWEWLHAEYPEYSADFLNQLMMGLVFHPPSVSRWYNAISYVGFCAVKISSILLSGIPAPRRKVFADTSCTPSKAAICSLVYPFEIKNSSTEGSFANADSISFFVPFARIADVWESKPSRS